mmetsp:Transcript_6291/g.13847  ORF Transcript_6291/g.13847 Transcript_6291/m.13847 type:complete len:425 (-) Transcript_6291:697-1971(-)
MFSRFNVAKCETQCRLALGRIKLLRNKRTLQIKQYRKEVAELLRTGKQDYARIRVEGVIREQLMLQAYETLELYLELMAVRSQLIDKTKEIPRDMVEAISSIIYAAQRISDMPELAQLRSLFATKYGKEYVAEATNDATSSKWQVNQNLIRCLLVEPPQPEDKLAALSEIAQEHGVEWDLSAAARDMLPNVGPAPGALAVPGQHGVPGHAVPGMPGMPPGAPGASYLDAQQAALAAAQAAEQAKMAADYAARFALQQQALAGVPGAASGAAPPSAGWLLHQTPAVGYQAPVLPPQGPPLTPSHSDASSVHSGPGDVRGPGVPPPGAPPPPPGGPSGGYTQRSNEDIQRAYDAALGPPTKGEHMASAPAHPAAPPAPPAAPPNVPKVHSGLDLPAPPTGLLPPNDGGGEEEYEELARRLDALKRS